MGCCQHRRSCWSAYSNFRVWWSIAIMCPVGRAKSSATKPSCTHQHRSLWGEIRQCWLCAYVGWGSGLVFNHNDRPSMALPWTAMYEAFSLRLQEKEDHGLENISTETTVWRAKWLVILVDIRYVHWIIWLLFLFHARMATSNRSGINTSLNLQDCEICQIWRTDFTRHK